MPDGPADGADGYSDRYSDGYSRMRKRSSRPHGVVHVSTADPRRSIGVKMALRTLEKLCVQLNSLDVCKPKLTDLASMMDARWRLMRERRQRQGHEAAAQATPTDMPCTAHVWTF